MPSQSLLSGWIAILHAPWGFQDGLSGALTAALDNWSRIDWSRSSSSK